MCLSSKTEKVIVKFQSFNFRIYCSFLLKISNLNIYGIEKMENEVRNLLKANNVLIPFNSLITLEAMVDQNEDLKYPFLILENIRIEHFVLNDEVFFGSLIKISSFLGSLIMNNTLIENLLFPKGLIIYDSDINHDPFYNFEKFTQLFVRYQKKIDGFNFSIEISNLTINNFNPFRVYEDFDFDFSLFLFDEWPGFMVVNHLNLENFTGFCLNSFIYKMEEGNGTFKIIRNNFFRTRLVSFLKSSSINLEINMINLTDFEYSNLFLDVKNSVSYLLIGNSYFQNVYSNNFQEEIKSFSILNSNLIMNYTNFSFLRNLAFKFTKCEIIFIDCKLNQMNFGKNSFQVILSKSKFYNSAFTNIFGDKAIFRIEESSEFITENSSFSNITGLSLFFCNKLDFFSLGNGHMSFLIDFEWIWDPNSIITFFLISNMTIKNMTYKVGILWIKNYVIMKFENSYFFGWRSTIKNMVSIRVISGGLYIKDCVFEEFISFPESYYLIGFEYCDGTLLRTKFINVGWDYPITFPNENSDLGNFIWYWSTLNVTIESCEFMNNGLYTVYSGFLFYTTNISPIIIKNTKFIIIDPLPNYQYMGVISTGSPDTIFDNNLIINLKCSNNVFDHSNGAIGFFVIPSYSRSKNNFNFQGENNTFINCSCNTGGGLGVINYKSVILKNFTFLNSKSIKGGHFVIVSSSYVDISEFNLISSISEKSSLFFIQNIDHLRMKDSMINGSVALSDSSLTCIQILEFYLSNTTVCNLKSHKIGGFLTMIGGNAYFQKLNFQNISSKEQGGVIVIKNSGNLIVKNVCLETVESDKGGFIYMDNGRTLIIESVEIINSHSYSFGSVLFINQIGLLLVNKLNISESIAQFYGVIFLKGNEINAKYSFHELNCKNNLALRGSCIYFESSNELFITDLKIEKCSGMTLYFFYFYAVNIMIQNLQLIDCMSEDYLIYVSGLTLKILLAIFQRNSVQRFMYLSKSQVNIENILLKNIKGSSAKSSWLFLIDTNINIESLIYEKEDSENQPSFLIATNSKIQILNSIIKELSLMENDGIITTEGSFLIIFNSSFIQNEGPVFHLFNSHLYCSLMVLESNKIYSSPSITDIDVDNNFANFFTSITLIKCFVKINNGISINIIGTSLLQINETIMIKVANSKMAQALLISNVLKIELFQCDFENFYHEKGAALTIVNTNSYLKEFVFLLKLNKSIFLNCASFFSGAIMINGSFNVFFNKSIFVNNSATNDANYESGNVGVLYYKCNKINFCNLTIENSGFFGNTAQKYFSTIFAESLLYQKNNLLLKNSAFSKESNQISNFPFDVKLVSVSTIDGETLDTINFVSGVSFNLTFQIIDNQGNILEFDNKSIATLTLESESRNSSLQNAVDQASQGIINFREVILKHPPNSFVPLDISLNFLNFEDFRWSFKKKYAFFSRLCEKGEILLKDYSCIKCSENYYSLEDPMKVNASSQKCNFCPENAECPGGSIIIPKPGFWRMNNITTLIVSCKLEQACLGKYNITFSMIRQDYGSYRDDSSLISGYCAEGHIGNLCQECEFGYGKYKAHELCTLCQNYDSLNTFRLVSLVLIIFIYILLNGRSMINDDNSAFSVISKIIFNHSNRISIVVVNELETIKQEARELFDTVNFLSFFTEDAFSNDCFLQSFSFEISDFFLMKVMVTLILPILISFVCIISFSAFSLIFFFSHLKESTELFFRKLFLMFLISVFLFYPLIIKCSLSLIKCQHLNDINYIPKSYLSTIDDQNFIYLDQGPNLKCWENTHKYYFSIAAVFGIFIWGFIFPFILFFIIWKTRNYKNSNPEQKRTRWTAKIFSKKKKKMANMKIDNANIQIRQKRNEKKLTWKEKIHLKMIQKTEIFNFFFKDYKPQYYYWESILFLQKFFLSFLPNLDLILEEEIILFLYLGIFSIYYFILECGPFYIHQLNTLERYSIISSVLVKLIMKICKHSNNTLLKISFVIISLILNILFYILSIFLFFQLTDWKSAWKNSLLIFPLFKMRIKLFIASFKGFFIGIKDGIQNCCKKRLKKSRLHFK